MKAANVLESKIERMKFSDAGKCMSISNIWYDNIFLDKKVGKMGGIIYIVNKMEQKIDKR